MSRRRTTTPYRRRTAAIPALIMGMVVVGCSAATSGGKGPGQALGEIIAGLILGGLLVAGIYLLDKYSRSRPQRYWIPPQYRETRVFSLYPEPVGERISRHIPQSVKIAVTQRDHGRCRVCGSGEDIQFDHVIPWSRGGLSTMQNVQLLCGSCNRRKSNKVAS